MVAGRAVIDVVLGLGASRGDEARNLALAVRSIAMCQGVLLRGCSRRYFSAPVGGVARLGFQNAAVAVSYSGSPEELLSRMKRIENRFGRRRGRRWMDRILDIDLLWGRGLVVEGPELSVPHPRLKERSFALIPLLELFPGAREPRTEKAYDRLRSNFAPLACLGTLGVPFRTLPGGEGRCIG